MECGAVREGAASSSLGVGTGGSPAQAKQGSEGEGAQASAGERAYQRASESGREGFRERVGEREREGEEGGGRGCAGTRAEVEIGEMETVQEVPAMVASWAKEGLSEDCVNSQTEK